MLIKQSSSTQSIKLQQKSMNNPEQAKQSIQVKSHVLKYCKPDDFQAWKGIGVTLFYFILSMALIKYDLGALGWTIMAFNNLRIFVQFHDMAHNSYFSTIRMNGIVGRIIGIYVHFAFDSWRDGHNHHHKHFGNLDRLDLSQTIIFTKKQYEKMTGVKKIMARVLREPIVFFLFSTPLLWFVLMIGVVVKRYGIFSKAFLERVCSVLYHLVIYKIFGFELFFMHAVSIYFGLVIGVVLFHLQHSVNAPYRQRKQKWNPTNAALEGSTFLEVPFFLKPFTNGIQFHHIHHLNTNVASYNMSKCHYEFDEKNIDKKWDVYYINRVDWWLSTKSMVNVMFDEEKGIVIPFRYDRL